VVPGTKIADAELDDTPVAISPDGQWLAFSIHTEPEGNETAHQTKIVLLNLGAAAGGAESKSANRIIKPDQRISGAASFTPDGRALVYPVREAGVDNLWLQPLDASASAAKRITNFTSDLIDAYHFSLDGKQLGVLQRHAVSDVVLLRDTSK
jgi:Tol biopolymer transport system component